MTLFKYRWHIRWYWFRVKRRMLQSSSDEILLPSTEHNFVCYVNYFGVTFEWIRREMITPLENYNIEAVFIYERNAMLEAPEENNVMDSINSSKKLLYVVGNERHVREKLFIFLLQIAMVERLEDIIIIYKEISAFESLQQEVPLPRPNKRNAVRHIQYEANEIFWPEIQQHLKSN